MLEVNFAPYVLSYQSHSCPHVQQERNGNLVDFTSTLYPPVGVTTEIVI